ncbi:MAG: exodeoxyribonuclease VII large subunit [Acetivibrionales bacterium]|jgi:exodeoxyribonuclease VII large subunit
MQHILSVSEINKYIKDVFSKDLVLSNLWVKGEISNFKLHSSGHMYFTLKDEKSILRSAMFRSYSSALKFRPENGMRVIIRGYVSIYERDGQYQLYVEEMQPDGIGSLHIAFEQLKEKLQKEGLFDPGKKRAIPFVPKSIGVITSITGSVIRDILHVLDRRFWNINLKVYPVQVQGEVAAKQISKAIEKLNELDNVEVIILARGGGSLEELWAFNDENLARCIFRSRIPVISAVGHETDYTVSDFVADLRAPTPSAAAEIVMPEKKVIKERIENLVVKLEAIVQKNIDSKRVKLERIINSAVFKQPYNTVNQERMRLDLLNRDLIKAINEYKEKNKNTAALLANKLDALSPLKILARGYSIVKNETSGKLVKSIQGTKKGDNLQIRLSDGILGCVVASKRKL